MTNKSASKTQQNHQSKSNRLENASRIVIEKEKVLRGPDGETGNKTRNMSEINDTLAFDLDGMVETVEESEDETDDLDEEGVWYQRHGRKLIEMVDEASEDIQQLTNEDVNDELEYWNNAVYGFVVGANPPWQIMEGFLKRIWNKFSVDKISFLLNGIFLERFTTEEMKNTPDIELTKEEVKSVPVWVRLHKLPLKFWGNSLKKIADLIGSYVKADNATELKTRLGFACVMVELKLGQKFPNSVKFRDEKHILIEIEVEYEWKPTICANCKQIGHEKVNCRRGKPASQHKQIRKVWRHVQQSAKQKQRVDNVEVQYVPEPNEGIVGLESTPITKHTGSHQTPGSPSPVKNVKISRQEALNVSRINQTSPTCLFGLLETKIKAVNMNKALNSVFRNWSVSTNMAFHNGGRIWVVWNHYMVDVSFLEYDAQYIHMYVTDKMTQKQFFHTLIYAFNGGDFNCITLAHERLGGNVTTAEVEPFQNSLDDCGLLDVQAMGAFYTWNNKQHVKTRVYSRIDRFLGNQAWIRDFPEYCSHFMPEILFDHTPCLVSLAKSSKPKNRPFKYFNMWSSAPGFLEIVAATWNQNIEWTKMYRLVRKMKALKPMLKSINSGHFYDIENNIKLGWSILDKKQKLIDSKTRMLILSQTIKVNKFIVAQGKICLEQHSQKLLEPITKAEIKDIMFHIPNKKAPDPDGFSSKFFKDAWDIVGNEVSELNATLVTLIPKVDRPSTMLQYRPIACCNVVYKCISKVLCNRLACMLPDLVSPNQGGFIQRRSIMENILICQDLIRLYGRNSVSPRCLFKLDLQKAYNIIEWDFLEQMMTAMKFPFKFRNWVMQCVTTASYSLNLNRDIFGFFKCQRGLR
ncbi:uncharacterized protein LOC141645046 [Silene latifolia]|uniref:uncharacterized protein LOC141645046 n=1 Tax=Silene latifolia TaxID=37657 RepID=UPI003D76DBAC